MNRMAAGNSAPDFDVFDGLLTRPFLIEASAGTGKTWNICALYLRLLLERRLEVPQILVVTFTNAATAELRERIRERLVDVLSCLQNGVGRRDDPFADKLIAASGRHAGIDRVEMQQRLEAALHNFDEAAVHTIHGFCQRVLAEIPFAAGEPFALELLADDADLRREAVADFWRRHVAGGELAPALADFLVRQRDSPATWSKLLARCQARNHARLLWPENIERTESLGLEAVNAAFALARACWRGDGQAASAVLRAKRSALNANSYSDSAIGDAVAAWTNWLAQDDPMAVPNLERSKIRLFAQRTIIDRTKKQQVPPVHEFFTAADDLIAAVLALQRALQHARLQLLHRLLDEASATLEQRKRRQRVHSFDDLLRKVAAALASPDFPGLAETLRRRYPVALIDEFQDTDPLQHAIFRRIYPPTGGPSVPFVLVGDPKQAIYSFRNADLHTYLSVRRQVSQRFTLRRNQRSTANLIAACNALFAANPRAFIFTDVCYETVTTGDRQHPPIDDQSGGETAALQVWRLPLEKGAALLRSAAQEQVVRATAAEIVRLLRAARAGTVKIGDRPLRAGDIAILVRHHAQGRRLRAALREAGVGSVEHSQQSVFHTRDAEELQRVLLAILEPNRPARLYAALATELMGYDAAAIAALGQDETRLLRALARFSAYRDTWFRQGASAMLRAWSNGESIPERLLARPDGERRMTNLLQLGELLQQAAAIDPAPEALLRWLAARRSDEVGDEVAQLRLESDRNLVQIVTIHKAKGLEYGIVFCPFLWERRPPRLPEEDGKCYHGDDDLPVIDFRTAVDPQAIRKRQETERDAEFMRLVYVALTRAVYRCYLVAGCYQSPAFGRPSTTESQRSLLNWLVAGASLDYCEWRVHKLTTAEIDAAWQTLANNARTVISLTDLPEAEYLGTVAPSDSAGALNVPEFRGEINTAWRIGSYSSLQHSAHAETAASDHDARAPLADPGQVPNQASEFTLTGLADDDILHFPRGPAAGDCLHALFERIDFTTRKRWPQVINEVLAAHPLALPGWPRTESAKRLPHMLTGMLNNVLATALPDDLVLDRIGWPQRLVEWGFTLPVGRVNAAELNACLAENGYSCSPLFFAPLHGYLRGFIDLVICHDDRYHVLDWKSNHLGFTAADYGRQSLAAAMSSNGYHLQYLLYSVAVHRHLRRCLPDYDYDHHFGAVLYLFVRGIRPDWNEETPAGERFPCGVFHHRPQRQTIDALDRLLASAPVR